MATSGSLSQQWTPFLRDWREKGLLRPLLPPLHVMGPWTFWLPPSCSISLAPSPVLQLAEDQAFFLVR